MKLTLNQIWLILTGVLIAIQAIGGYDPALAPPALALKLLLLSVQTAVISLLMLQLALAYVRHQLREARPQVGGDPAASVNPHAAIPVGRLVSDVRAGPGRPAGRIQIPTVDGLVDIGDPRVGDLLATLARARQGDPDARALAARWDLPRSTTQSWAAQRRKLGLDGTVAQEGAGAGSVVPTEQ